MAIFGFNAEKTFADIAKKQLFGKPEQLKLKER